MGTSKRLATPGNADNQPIAPKSTEQADAVTTASRTSFGTGPADTIAKSGDLKVGRAAGRYDARGNGVQVITLSSFGGTDEFTITAHLDGTLIGTTIAFTRGTDAAASDIQTALRSLLPGTDLTVVAGTTDAGPFTVTFNDDEFYSRHFPKLTITGTGCTGVVTAAPSSGVRRFLGETKYEGTTELVGPTIGTITVTDSVDEVQKVAFGAGTDGGSFELGFRRGTSGALAWNAEVSAIQAAVDNMFAQAGLAASAAPTARWVTPSVVEVEFVDWDTTDDAILTYDTTDASDSLEFATLDAGASAAARIAIVVAWVKTIDAFVGSDVTATEETENFKYNVTFHDGPRSILAADFSLAVTGTAGEDTSPDAITVLDAEAGVQFTFDGGALAGRPVRGGIQIRVDALTDGGVAEPATHSVVTPGVLGSASAAYTEQATVGDSILAEAENVVTHQKYGNGVTDAGTPVVIGSLPPADYLLVCRTVADLAVSAASTKTFTVA